MRVRAGLVLEGGAARGVFTAGALDFLMEQELYFDYVCGVSAGACNAVDYVSRQIGRTRDAMIPANRRNRMFKLSTVFTQRSLIDMEMLFDAFPNRLIPFDYETYFGSDIKCETVVTNCRTGRAEYMDNREDRDLLMDILEASAAIPLFSRKVRIGADEYVDGGVADPIPLKRARALGYEKDLVIMTRMPGYRKSAPGKLESALYKTFYSKYPELMEVLLTRYKDYNKELEELEEMASDGEVFLLRPEITPVGRLEMKPEKLMPFYEHGYDLMKKRYDELLRYLG